MKNYTHVLAAALLSCSLTYADEALIPATHTESKNHRFYVGPDIFVQHSSYANTVFGGLRVGYDGLKPQAFYFGMDGLIAAGERSHRHWKAEHTPLFANIEQRYGYTFQSPIFAKSTITPFAGMGWYYMGNKSEASVNWFYGAAGLKMNQRFSENFDIGFNLKAMYAFAERLKTNWYHSSFELKNHWGYEVGLPLTLHVGESKKWDLQFQPYLIKLDVNRGSHIIGARMEAGYNF